MLTGDGLWNSTGEERGTSEVSDATPEDELVEEILMTELSVSFKESFWTVNLVERLISDWFGDS